MKKETNNTLQDIILQRNPSNDVTVSQGLPVLHRKEAKVLLFLLVSDSSVGRPTSRMPEIVPEMQLAGPAVCWPCAYHSVSMLHNKQL